MFYSVPGFLPFDQKNLPERSSAPVQGWRMEEATPPGAASENSTRAESAPAGLLWAPCTGFLAFGGSLDSDRRVRKRGPQTPCSSDTAAITPGKHWGETNRGWPWGATDRGSRWKSSRQVFPQGPWVSWSPWQPWSPLDLSQPPGARRTIAAHFCRGP
eukprot:bmy_01420T0